MSRRTALIPLIDRIRGLTGPGGFDLRLHQLSIIVRTWSGSRLRDGTPTDSVTTLDQKFRVRTLGMHEISGSGGAYRAGDVVIENITPSNGAGVGFTVEQLRPTLTGNNQQRIYQLAGPQSGEFNEVQLETYRPFSWRMVLRRLNTTP